MNKLILFIIESLLIGIIIKLLLAKGFSGLSIFLISFLMVALIVIIGYILIKD